MIPFLVISKGNERGEIIQLPMDAARIGRDPACEIVLTDAQVSRHHVQIHHEDASWIVEDLNSSNGTLVNGERIDEAPVAHGDIIIIGATMMVFHLAAKPPTFEAPEQSYGKTQTISIDVSPLLRSWEGRRDSDSGKRAKKDLEALYRFGRTINSILEPAELIAEILSLMFQELEHVERGSVYLIDDDTGDLECHGFQVRDAESPSQGPVFNATMAEQVIQENSAILKYDALTEQGISDRNRAQTQQIRAAICAPLQTQDRVLGVLFLDSYSPQSRFTKSDLRLVTAIGLQSGIAIENARLYQRTTREKAALEEANRELRSTRHQLVQSEKSAVVGRLASGIVHDMKSPMAVILGYAGYIRSKLSELPPEVVEQTGIPAMVSRIEEGVEHVNGVIEHLLMFVKPASINWSDVDVNHLVRETVRFLQHETNRARIRVNVNLAEDLPSVSADPNQLKQVFINILLNAVQAIDDGGGTITIETSHRVTDGHRFVVIQITDDGCGMTAEEQEHVFEPFYTTKPTEEGIGGFGLGLSVSHGMVQSHGGRISVKSKKGKGTTFCIELPVDAPA